MNRETQGAVLSVYKCWWIKVNTKPIRAHFADGAVYPHIVTVAYAAGLREYTKRKWIHAGHSVPAVGQAVTVVYDEKNPAKASILI